MCGNDASGAQPVRRDRLLNMHTDVVCLRKCCGDVSPQPAGIYPPDFSGEGPTELKFIGQMILRTLARLSTGTGGPVDTVVMSACPMSIVSL